MRANDAEHSVFYSPNFNLSQTEGLSTFLPLYLYISHSISSLLFFPPVTLVVFHNDPPNHRSRRTGHNLLRTPNTLRH
jgi:hypothetical protein